MRHTVPSGRIMSLTGGFFLLQMQKCVQALVEMACQTTQDVIGNMSTRLAFLTRTRVEFIVLLGVLLCILILVDKVPRTVRVHHVKTKTKCLPSIHEVVYETHDDGAVHAKGNICPTHP